MDRSNSFTCIRLGYLHLLLARYATAEVCNESAAGLYLDDYEGCQDTTVTGAKCQSWDSQWPHTHPHGNNRSLARLSKNYCRNPSNEVTIWCYTTNPSIRWEHCRPACQHLGSQAACLAATSAGFGGRKHCQWNDVDLTCINNACADDDEALQQLAHIPDEKVPANFNKHLFRTLQQWLKVANASQMSPCATFEDSNLCPDEGGDTKYIQGGGKFKDTYRLAGFACAKTCGACADPTCNSSMWDPVASLCIPCEQGKSYSNATGEDTCALCPLGWWQQLQGQKSCNACLPGQTTLRRGATTVRECFCMAGWYGGGETECKRCPAQMLSPIGSAGLDECFCSSGDFPNKPVGASGAVCSACDHGIQCDSVGGSPRGKPVLLPGFAAVLRTSLANVTSLSDFELSQCVNLDACPGGELGTCSEGGRGRSCAECSVGYALSAGICVSCPEPTWLMVLVVPVTVSVIVVLTHKLCKELRTKEMSAKVSIAISFGLLFHAFQMCLVINQLRMQGFLLDFFARFSMMINAYHLDCYFADPVGTYMFTSCLPGLALLGFCLLGMFGRSANSKGAALNSAGTLFQAVFIMILLHGLAPFIVFEQPNGTLSMLSHPSIIQGSHEHFLMSCIAVAQLVFYCGGFVGLCCSACFKVHVAKQQAVNLNDRVNETIVKDLLQKWHFLFFRFNSDRYYWGLVLIARSTLLSLVPVVSAGPFPWVTLQCVLMCFLVLNMQLRPWRELAFNTLDTYSQALFILLVSALQDTKLHDFAIVLLCAITAILVGTVAFSLRPKPKEDDEAHALELLSPMPCVPTFDVRLTPDALIALQEQSALIERCHVSGGGISQVCDAELSLDAYTKALNIKVTSNGLMWKGQALSRERRLLAMMGRLTAASMDGVIILQSPSNRIVVSANQQARILLGSMQSMIGKSFDNFTSQPEKFEQFLSDAQKMQEGPALMQNLLLCNGAGHEIEVRVFCVAMPELVVLALQKVEDLETEERPSPRGEMGSVSSSAPATADGFLKAELYVQEGMLQNCCGTWCNEFQTATSHSLFEILSQEAIDEVLRKAYEVLSTDSERLIAPSTIRRKDGSRSVAIGIIDKHELTDPSDPGVVRLRLQIVPVGGKTSGHAYAPVTYQSSQPTVIGRPSTMHTGDTALETPDADLENLVAKSDSLAYTGSQFHPKSDSAGCTGTELTMGSLHLTEAESGVQIAQRIIDSKPAVAAPQLLDKAQQTEDSWMPKREGVVRNNFCPPPVTTKSADFGQAEQNRDLAALKSQAKRAQQAADRLKMRIDVLETPPQSDGSESAADSSNSFRSRQYSAQRSPASPASRKSSKDSSPAVISTIPRQEIYSNMQHTPISTLRIGLKQLMKHTYRPLEVNRKCCPHHGTVETLQAVLHGYSAQKCKAFHSYDGKQCKHCFAVHSDHDFCILCGGEDFQQRRFESL